MTDLRQAAQQALEALETNQPVNYCMNNNGEKFPMMQEDPFRFERNSKAITALRTALEQQQAEPPPEWPLIKNILAVFGLDAIAFVAEWQAAKRPWVGLKSEEILDMFDRNNVYGSKWIEFARTVETKLKEKNDLHKD